MKNSNEIGNDTIKIKEVLQNRDNGFVNDISINNKSMKKSHKFTLVIPTYNRHQYLKRSIEFFKNLEADIVYCDSSEHKYNGKFAQNMRYLHLPGIKFESKLKKTFEQINTEFIALCADDDFAVYDTLYKCAEFLDKNREYSTVLGKFLGFKYYFDGNFMEMYKHIKITDLNDKDLRTRAEKYFTAYFQTIWAMHRRNDLIETMNICEKCNFKNIIFIEMTIAAIACARGCINVLPYLWGARELYTPYKNNKIKYIYHINKDASVKEDYNKMKENIDKVVYNGYSDFVLECYLKFCKSHGIK